MLGSGGGFEGCWGPVKQGGWGGGYPVKRTGLV